MGALAEAILAKALRVRRASATGRSATTVQRDDLEIDRLDVEIDDAILRALALQAPVAEDLRQVIAIKTMATDLERVGDIARNIAQERRAPGRAAAHRPARRGSSRSRTRPASQLRAPRSTASRPRRGRARRP